MGVTFNASEVKQNRSPNFKTAINLTPLDCPSQPFKNIHAPRRDSVTIQKAIEVVRQTLRSYSASGAGSSSITCTKVFSGLFA